MPFIDDVSVCAFNETSCIHVQRPPLSGHGTDHFSCAAQVGSHVICLSKAVLFCKWQTQTDDMQQACQEHITSALPGRCRIDWAVLFSPEQSSVL